jgi:hypothetical protein
MMCVIGCVAQAKKATNDALALLPSASQTNEGNQIVLIVRHAEKPLAGPELSPLGEQRAKAYVNYFRNYQIDGKPLVIDYLYAARDSKQSERPRLTLEPLAAALGKTIDSRFDDNQTGKITKDIQKLRSDQNLLISWRHSKISNLIRALGANPASLLPNGDWPDEQYSWVIELRFKNGKLTGSRLVEENIVFSQTSATNAPAKLEPKAVPSL